MSVKYLGLYGKRYNKILVNVLMSKPVMFNRAYSDVVRPIKHHLKNCVKAETATVSSTEGGKETLAKFSKVPSKQPAPLEGENSAVNTLPKNGISTNHVLSSGPQPLKRTEQKQPLSEGAPLPPLVKHFPCEDISEDDKDSAHSLNMPELCSNPRLLFPTRAGPCAVLKDTQRLSPERKWYTWSYDRLKVLPPNVQAFCETAKHVKPRKSTHKYRQFYIDTQCGQMAAETQSERMDMPFRQDINTFHMTQKVTPLEDIARPKMLEKEHKNPERQEKINKFEATSVKRNQYHLYESLKKDPNSLNQWIEAKSIKFQPPEGKTFSFESFRRECIVKSLRRRMRSAVKTANGSHKDAGKRVAEGRETPLVTTPVQLPAIHLTAPAVMGTPTATEQPSVVSLPPEGLMTSFDVSYIKPGLEIVQKSDTSLVNRQTQDPPQATTHNAHRPTDKNKDVSSDGSDHKDKIQFTSYATCRKKTKTTVCPKNEVPCQKQEMDEKAGKCSSSNHKRHLSPLKKCAVMNGRCNSIIPSATFFFHKRSSRAGFITSKERAQYAIAIMKSLQSENNYVIWKPSNKMPRFALITNPFSRDENNRALTRFKTTLFKGCLNDNQYNGREFFKHEPLLFAEQFDINTELDNDRNHSNQDDADLQSIIFQAAFNWLPDPRQKIQFQPPIFVVKNSPDCKATWSWLLSAINKQSFKDPKHTTDRSTKSDVDPIFIVNKNARDTLKDSKAKNVWTEDVSQQSADNLPSELPGDFRTSQVSHEIKGVSLVDYKTVEPFSVNDFTTSTELLDDICPEPQKTFIKPYCQKKAMLLLFDGLVHELAHEQSLGLLPSWSAYVRDKDDAVAKFVQNKGNDGFNNQKECANIAGKISKIKHINRVKEKQQELWKKKAVGAVVQPKITQNGVGKKSTIAVQGSKGKTELKEENSYLPRKSCIKTRWKPNAYDEQTYVKKMLKSRPKWKESKKQDKNLDANANSKEKKAAKLQPNIPKKSSNSKNLNQEVLKPNCDLKMSAHKQATGVRASIMKAMTACRNWVVRAREKKIMTPKPAEEIFISNVTIAGTIPTAFVSAGDTKRQDSKSSSSMNVDIPARTFKTIKYKRRDDSSISINLNLTFAEGWLPTSHSQSERLSNSSSIVVINDKRVIQSFSDPQISTSLYASTESSTIEPVNSTSKIELMSTQYRCIATKVDIYPDSFNDEYPTSIRDTLQQSTDTANVDAVQHKYDTNDIQNLEKPDILESNIFRKLSKPDEPLGPDANKSSVYKNPEFFAYHRYSYVDVLKDIQEMKKKNNNDQS